MMRYEFAVGIDIKKEVLCTANGLVLLRADAQNLPFRDLSFELITMFSLIEHVQRPDACLREAFRVLRNDGKLFMQFPNRYFPIELHSGLPLYFYLPKRIRLWFAARAGIWWMKNTDVPSLRSLRKLLNKIQGSRQLQCLVAGFHYPESFLPESRILAFLYWLIKGTHMFRILPMGYVAIVSRAETK
jgi:ubiquinone/menaquinone biosynthesis C-methylase UbiE